MSDKHFLRATHGSRDKPLKVGDIEISCYVLEDGTRVLSGRGMQTALTLGQRHGALLKQFLGRKNLKPYINDELAMALSLTNGFRFFLPKNCFKSAPWRCPSVKAILGEKEPKTIH